MSSIYGDARAARPDLGPKRVLVTRAIHDAPALARRLADAGFEPVIVPLLEIRWLPLAVAEAAVAHPTVDRVLVTSAVTADVLAVGAPNAWRAARWAAVGPATADRLHRHGYACATAPERATGDDLVQALGDLTGQTVLLPRSELADAALVRAIEARGGTAIEVVCYANVAPAGYAARLRAALPVHATTVMSGSAAERLAEGLVPEERGGLGRIVVIGPTTADAAHDHGLPVHAVARPHTIDGLVSAVLATVGGR